MKFFLLGIYIAFLLWCIYRIGYEAGREYELDREAERLQKEWEQLDEDGK